LAIWVHTLHTSPNGWDPNKLKENIMNIEQDGGPINPNKPAGPAFDRAPATPMDESDEPGPQE
jgi:hypothetical protein